MRTGDREIRMMSRLEILQEAKDRAVQILEETEKRRKALEFQAQLAQQYGAGHPVNQAAGGRAGRAEEAPAGKKIASSSAGARAPEARARGARQKAAEIIPEIPESRRTKPNKRENEFMMNLMVLRNTLHRNGPACRERAKLAGRNVWRDIRLMTTLVDKVQDALLRTMPQSRDEYYSAYARHGHYELHIDGPIRTCRHLLITDVHLAAMAEAAMKSECVLCMREGAEIGQCPLRDALLETAVPTEVEPDGLIRKCEYRDAAGSLIMGKDVTV